MASIVTYTLLISLPLSLYLLLSTRRAMQQIAREEIRAHDASQSATLLSSSARQLRAVDVDPESGDADGGETFPVIYNKPPKTASTFVVSLMREWAKMNGRTFSNCRGQRALETTVYLTDCLPARHDRSLLFGSHFYLTDSVHKTLQKRLPSARFFTTTRFPATRIFSLFLETFQINLTDTTSGSAADGSHATVDDRFADFLAAFNPWGLYNFHTGELRKGGCPLSVSEKTDVFLMASRYDIVIDASLREESNAILNHFSLFQIPHSQQTWRRKRFRNSGTFNMSLRSKHLLADVTCVEDELNRALLLRMASLLELATPVHCINHGTIDSLSSCLEQKQIDALDATWLV